MFSPQALGHAIPHLTKSKLSSPAPKVLPGSSSAPLVTFGLISTLFLAHFALTTLVPL